jgi:hypothetical protein
MILALYSGNFHAEEGQDGRLEVQALGEKKGNRIVEIPRTIRMLLARS